MITPILLQIMYYLLEVYYFIMIVGIFLTWIPFLFQYKFFRILYNIGGGYLNYFRGKLVIAFLDFTPMIGLILYGFMLSILYSMINV